MTGTFATCGSQTSIGPTALARRYEHDLDLVVGRREFGLDGRLAGVLPGDTHASQTVGALR